MANLIGVVGNPSTGKSTSIRNLDSKQTAIVSPVSKPLPFKGSKQMYNSENKNYLESDDWQKIVAYMKHVSDNMKDIKNLILDDIGLVMSIEYMKRADEAGFNKFVAIGQHMFNIINAAKSLRDDLNVVFLFHSEDVMSDNIIVDQKIKTCGKLLDNYFTPEALFTILFYTDVQFEKKDGTAEYTFVTNKTKKYPAKSPMGMFPLNIPNDLKTVIDTSREYYA